MQKEEQSKTEKVKKQDEINSEPSIDNSNKGKAKKHEENNSGFTNKGKLKKK